MPTYRVTAPDGRKFKLTGDSPPTEAELEEVFASMGPARESVMASTPEPESKSVGQHVKEGLGALWDTAGPVAIAKGLGQMVTHPIDTAKAVIVDAPIQQGQKAGEALIRGGERLANSVADKIAGEGDVSIPGLAGAVASGYVDAVPDMMSAGGNALAGVVPLIGPAAAHAGEQIAEGNVGQGLGEGVGLLAGPKLGKAYTQAVVAPVRKLAAPLSGKVNPAVAEAAKRQGVEMPASALSDSKVVPLGESLAAKGPMGGQAAARFERAVASLTEKADDVATQASKYTDDLERGRAIANGVDEYKAKWEKTKNDLYREAEIPSKMKFFTRADDVVSFIDDVLAEKRAASRHMGKAAPEEAALTRLRAALTSAGKKGRTPKDIQVRDLRALKRQFVDPNTDFKAAVATGDAAVYRKLGAMMDDQVDTAIQKADPQLYAKIEQAKTVYKEGLSKLTSTYGEDISKLAQEGKYDLIAKAVVNRRMSSGDIPGILEVAGAEGADAMRAATIADLVSKAKNKGPQLTPQGLSKAMNEIGRDKLQAILTPEQFKNLDDIATLSRSMEKGSKVMNGSQTAFLQRGGAYLPAFMVNPGAALATLLGDAAASKFLASRFGQRWMTTGYMPISGALGNYISKSASQVARPAASVHRMPTPQARPAYPRAADKDEKKDPRGERVATR